MVMVRDTAIAVTADAPARERGTTADRSPSGRCGGRADNATTVERTENAVRNDLRTALRF